jgi:hypothetical protein
MSQSVQFAAQEPYDVVNLLGGMLAGDEKPEPRGLQRTAGKMMGSTLTPPVSKRSVSLPALTRSPTITDRIA